MFGMLEFNENIRRVRSEDLILLGEKIRVVTIPNTKRRYLKKAKKILGNCRVIIPEDRDKENLYACGIMPIEHQRLYKYVAGKIYVKTLEYFNLSPFKANVLVCGGRLSSHGMSEIIKNARYISLRASNGEELSDELMEDYGISVAGVSNPNIVLYMYEKDFSVHFFNGEKRYALRDISVFSPQIDMWLPKSYFKSACVAFIEAGKIKISEIQVGDISFYCEN